MSQCRCACYKQSIAMPRASVQTYLDVMKKFNPKENLQMSIKVAQK